MRWQAAWLSVCSGALALAGCGGDAERTTEPMPKLPAALAERLAADADAVAASLQAGDRCGAAERAAALQQRAIDALNRPGAVPAALKEDLGLGVADLVDRARSECAAAQPPPAPPTAPPPPATTAVDEDDRGEDEGDDGRGKKKGHGKGKKRR